MISANKILQALEKIFPNAHCELNYRSLYELAISVVLSAQTTDKRVNIVTPTLFDQYPDFAALAKAELTDVAMIIQSIGLYHSKAKNIIALSQIIEDVHHGDVPNDFDALTALPGVGRKTANVILSEGFYVPAIAVDTHVTRVAKRLGIASIDDDVYEIEMKMRDFFPKEKWHQAHQLFVHYGRYICKAKQPDCSRCPFGCPEKQSDDNLS